MRIFALILFVILLPLMFVISLTILICMGFPIVFKQKRLGKNKKLFVIYKFRSMQDGKTTFLGKILRNTGFDELPQLINIVLDQMSMVGPRPLTEQDVVRLGWENKMAAKRWIVKPGITGKAQLQGVCDAKLSLQNDISYIENKCFSLDMKIFFKSLFVPIKGKGANQMKKNR
jgi:lipopolysaccharide/colanic/teichoic acid biosynthesis glycosyltransferase